MEQMFKEFKVGDKVRCINNNCQSTMLVLNKIYTITDRTDNGTFISIDKSGFQYSVLRFVKDVREEKLRRILK